MSDKKISQLPSSTTPLAGTEVVPIVQGGVTSKVPVSDLTAGRSISTAGVSANGAGNIQTIGAGNIGYGTGSGGTVTQTGSKGSGVTLNKRTGRITMNNAALAGGATASFYLTNSTITNDDVVVVNIFGSGSYRAVVETSYNSTALISVTNTTGGSLSDAVAINFAVIKCATS